MTAAPALPLASPARLRSQIGRVGWLLGAFAGSAAIVILTMRAVSRVAGLFPDAVPAHPYFLPAHAGLLYVVAPIAVLAACVFLLLPGVTLALALGGDARLGPLLLKGLALTFPLHTLAEWVVRTVHGGPMTPDGFLVAVAVDGTVALGLLAWRVRHGRQPEWPVQGSAFWRRLGWLALVPTVAVVGFLPDIFWQDLSADGWEAFEMGRSLASHVLPRFPTPSGTLGLGIGMVPMTYPVHWFGMIFGLAEPAPRLPCLMYLMLLYAALTALIELASPRVLRATEEGVLFLCVAVFAVALGFNASYSAYFADLASPGGLDILTAALLAGLIYFLWSAELSWFLLFAGLSYLARPTALLVLLLLGIAALGFGGRHRSQQLRYVALALGLSVLVMLGYELIFARLVGDGAHPGYDSQSVIERFRYLQFHDPARLLFAVLPGGLAPFAALLAFRRQDAMARSLALVTVGYVLVFLFPAFTNMHHFVPAMILPIAVAGRVLLARPYSRTLPLVGALGAVLAFGLSLPHRFTVDHAIRRLAQRVVYRIGDYQGSYAGFREALEGADLIHSLFPQPWDIRDPSKEMEVTGDQIIYYATRAKPDPKPRATYQILPNSMAPPPGYFRAAATPIGAAYVADSVTWARDRDHGEPTDFRAPVYRISRETLFPALGVRAHHYDVDLRALPLLWRLFRAPKFSHHPPQNG